MSKQLGINLIPALKETDNDGKTFVHYLVVNNNLSQVVKLAKDLKVNLMPILKTKDNNKETFLHKAVNFGNLDSVIPIVKALKLDLTPLIQEKNKKGQTFLDLAERKGIKKQAEKFIREIKKIKILQNMENSSKDTETYKDVIKKRKKTVSIDLLKNKQNSR